MSNLGHTAARATASKIIDVLLKNMGRDREKEMVRLIDFMEKYMSGEKLDIDYDKITDNISVRTKKEGDRFYPVGVDFSKSLKRFFIDRKIPAALRLKLPLLTDGGNIAAIIGREVDSRYAVGSDTKRIMAVELINMEEEYA